MIDEVKAALVEVMDTPFALVKPKSDETFKFVVVAFEIFAFVPEIFVLVRLPPFAFVNPSRAANKLVLVTFVMVVLFKFVIPEA